MVVVISSNRSTNSCEDCMAREGITVACERGNDIRLFVNFSKLSILKDSGINPKEFINGINRKRNFKQKFNF